MDQSHSNAIRHFEDGFVVDAMLVAGKLGLSPDAFWREMKRGIVYGVAERGEGDDAGRMRLTFRYRARSWSMTLENKKLTGVASLPSHSDCRAATGKSAYPCGNIMS
jgi:hypothetical protein